MPITTIKFIILLLLLIVIIIIILIVVVIVIVIVIIVVVTAIIISLTILVLLFCDVLCVYVSLCVSISHQTQVLMHIQCHGWNAPTQVSERS